MADPGGAHHTTGTGEFDLVALAHTRRMRVEARALLIASQVRDGASVHLGPVQYWVTQAQGRISQELGNASYEERVPVLVRGDVSLVDVTRDMPLPAEYTYISNAARDGRRPAVLDRASEADIEEAALELDAVEEKFLEVIDIEGRRGEPEVEVDGQDLGGF